MDDATFIRESFRASILFSLLALFALLLSALWFGAHAGVLCALLAIGAAYLSQGFGTWATGRPALQRIALGLQLASALLWVFGFLSVWRA